MFFLVKRPVNNHGSPAWKIEARLVDQPVLRGSHGSHAKTKMRSVVDESQHAVDHFCSFSNGFV